MSTPQERLPNLDALFEPPPPTIKVPKPGRVKQQAVTATPPPADGLPDLSHLFEPPAPVDAPPTPPRAHSTGAREVFQPQGASWSIDHADGVKQFYRGTFGRDLPVSAFGQSGTHDKMGLDHSHSMDVPLHPDSKEGRALTDYLRTNGIPFLAYDRAVSGGATGAHIHVGNPSHGLGAGGNESSYLSDLPNLDALFEPQDAQAEDDEVVRVNSIPASRVVAPMRPPAPSPRAPLNPYSLEDREQRDLAAAARVRAVTLPLSRSLADYKDAPELMADAYRHGARALNIPSDYVEEWIKSHPNDLQLINSATGELHTPADLLGSSVHDERRGTVRLNLGGLSDLERDYQAQRSLLTRVTDAATDDTTTAGEKASSAVGMTLRPLGTLSTGAAGLQRSVSTSIGALAGDEESQKVLDSDIYSPVNIIKATWERFKTGEVPEGFEQPIAQGLDLLYQKKNKMPLPAWRRMALEIIGDPMNYASLNLVGEGARALKGTRVGQRLLPRGLTVLDIEKAADDGSRYLVKIGDSKGVKQTIEVSPSVGDEVRDAGATWGHVEQKPESVGVEPGRIGPHEGRDQLRMVANGEKPVTIEAVERGGLRGSWVKDGQEVGALTDKRNLTKYKAHAESLGLVTVEAPHPLNPKNRLLVTARTQAEADEALSRFQAAYAGGADAVDYAEVGRVLGYSDADIDAYVRAKREGRGLTEAEVKANFEANLKVERDIDKLAAETPASASAGEAAKPTTYGAQNALVTADRAAAARARLRQKLSPNRLNAGLDPSVLADMAEIAAFHVEAGARDFAAFSARMLEDVGDEVQPYLRDLFDHSFTRLDLTPPSATTAAAESVATQARTPLPEIISSVRKAGLLTGIKTHARNVLGTGAFQVAEEASRVPAAVADIIVSMATGRRTVGGADLGSFLYATRQAATKGVREARQIMKHGIDAEGMRQLQVTQELNSGSRILDAYTNTTFRLLNAEDKIFRTFAVSRSLEEQAAVIARNEARAGKIARSEIKSRALDLRTNPTPQMETQAISDAEFATFNNDNFVTSNITGPVRQKLRESTKGRWANAAIDLVLPFDRTPTNIIARILEYSGGLPVSVGKLGYQAAAKKITGRVFTEADQKAFAQTFGRGSVGATLLTLGYVLHANGLMTGMYDDEQDERGRNNVQRAAGQPPMAVRVGNTWHQVGAFSPLGNLLAIGATLHRERTQPLKHEEDRPGRMLDIGKDVIMQQPLLQAAREVTDDGRASERLGRVTGSFVPTIVADVADALDDKQREARGFGAQVQKRVPFARAGLPEAEDVFGRPLEHRRTAAVDPTGTTTARDGQVERELQRLQVGIGKLKKTDAETETERRARLHTDGAELYQTLTELISSREYQGMTDADRRAALSKEVRTTRARQTRERKE